MKKYTKSGLFIFTCCLLKFMQKRAAIFDESDMS